VFHNSNKSIKLLTLIKTTVVHTVFVLFASQLTAALTFSMRTSSCKNVIRSVHLKLKLKGIYTVVQLNQALEICFHW